jgi:hypothetical protein
VRDRRFVVWDAEGAPLGAFVDFETAHEWSHLRVMRAHTKVPLTVDDRHAKVSRRLWRSRCELVAWKEFTVLPNCDLRTPGAVPAAMANLRPAPHPLP